MAWFIGADLKERLLLWLALSGAAILLERVTERTISGDQTIYYEDPEDSDGMLRK